VWDTVDFRGLTNDVKATVQTNYTALHGAPTFANLLSNTLIKRVSSLQYITANINTLVLLVLDTIASTQCYSSQCFAFYNKYAVQSLRVCVPDSCYSLTLRATSQLNMCILICCVCL
jgi:hypothetical protein